MASQRAAGLVGAACAASCHAAATLLRRQRGSWQPPERRVLGSRRSMGGCCPGCVVGATQAVQTLPEAPGRSHPTGAVPAATSAGRTGYLPACCVGTSGRADCLQACDVVTAGGAGWYAKACHCLRSCFHLAAQRRLCGIAVCWRHTKVQGRRGVEAVVDHQTVRCAPLQEWLIAGGGGGGWPARGWAAAALAPPAVAPPSRLSGVACCQVAAGRLKMLGTRQSPYFASNSVLPFRCNAFSDGWLARCFQPICRSARQCL